MSHRNAIYRSEKWVAPGAESWGGVRHATVEIRVFYPPGAQRAPIQDVIEQLAAEAVEQLWDQKVDEEVRG